MILGNVATNLALHTAVMSSMNASRHHYHGGGNLDGAEACLVFFIAIWIIYATMVVFVLLTGEYTSKKQFVLDLVIPFRGLYRILKKEFCRLG